ncbi:MAG: AbrB/MazE/SpoVT family DNA-binding domain-containing protein [bacterium]|nr:AbrB/MazE/SpoVT family DNA-binding domain-containing protein [bacterium]
MSTATAKVTSKGQVTVPKPIRRNLSIHEGDQLLFVSDGQRVYIEKLPRDVQPEQVFGRLHREGTGKLDIEKARIEVKKQRAQKFLEEQSTYGNND